MLRIVAWTARFIRNSRLKKQERMMGPLTTDEIKNQHLFWTKRPQEIQSDDVTDDRQTLGFEENDQGILICRGRVQVHYPVLLVFSVTPFKIDQNKNRNRSTDKVQNLVNERRYIYKDPRQDSGQRNISYTRYPKKCFTQTYRNLYGDAMLVLTWMSSNMANGNQQKHLLPSFATKA